MTLQTEKQIITIHILPNITRRKCNQNEIWSDNRSQLEKYSTSKIME